MIEGNAANHTAILSDIACQKKKGGGGDKGKIWATIVSDIACQKKGEGEKGNIWATTQRKRAKPRFLYEGENKAALTSPTDMLVSLATGHAAL